MSRRLVITNSDAGSGHLLRIRRGDSNLVLMHRLVRDRVPSTARPEDFFAEREALYLNDPQQCGRWEDDFDEGSSQRLGFIQEQWRDYDEIEFWADPGPNAQLVLIQFVDWFSRLDSEAVARLRLVQSDQAIATRGVTDLINHPPRPVVVRPRHVTLAKKAWGAFCSVTPEQWAALLDDDLSALPFLRRTVLRMLGELPNRNTALGGSEARLLSMLKTGPSSPGSLLASFSVAFDHYTLDYWEGGKLLDDLAAGRDPVVVGLAEGPFTQDMHMDSTRFDRYDMSRIELSSFGHALVEGRADLADRRKINRWWGGTRLMSDAVWRWDEETRSLLPPATPADSPV